MADDVTINTGAGQPGATNVVVASDEVGGKQFQRMKIDVGADGATAPLSATNPLPMILPDDAQTGSGAVRVGSTKTKFFEGFGAWPNSTVWDSTINANDYAASLGNCAGVSYLGIIKCVTTPNSYSEIISKSVLSTPLEANIGVSWSNQIQGQFASIEFVGVDANNAIESDTLPTSVTITGLSVTSNVVTVTTATAHGYVVGNIVALSGNLDNRFNQGPIAIVNVLTPTTFTFAYTVGDATYSAGGYGVVDLICPCSGAKNSFGFALMETNDDNVRYFTRSGSGPVFVSGSSSLGTDWRQSAIPSGYDAANMDAHNARANVYLRYRQEQFLIQTRTNDSQSTPLNGGYVRTQNLPDPRKDYKIRARVTNLKNLTRPVARITSIAKAGSTTTTVTLDITCAAAGIATNNYVSIMGVADQTNFANTNNVIVTVTGANTFTCAVAGTGTATVTTGGSVFICEGNQNTTALGQAINSISRTSNVLSVVGNTTWSGMTRGEWYTIHGMSGSGTQYEGRYKLLNASTSTLTFESVGTDFGSITTGGSVIENTILRLHQMTILDLTRFLAEIASGKGTNIDSDAISIRGTATVSASNLSCNIAQWAGQSASNGGANGSVQVGGRQAHDAAFADNPLGIAACGRSTNYAAVADNDAAKITSTLVGAVINRPYSIPELEWAINDSITNSNTAIQVKAATASNKNYVTGLSIASATLGAAGYIMLRSTPIASSTATISGNTLVMAGTYNWKVGDLVLVTVSNVVGLTAGNYYHLLTVSGTSLTFSAARGGSVAAISGTNVAATLAKVMWRTTLQTTSLPLTPIVFNDPIDGGTGLAIEMITPSALTSGVVDFNVTGHVAP